MALFWTDLLVQCCSDVAACKKWWIEYFDCTGTPVPADWDDPLPSDVALQLPGHDRPTIQLTDRTEGQAAGFEPSYDHPVLFCSSLRKARAHLEQRGAAPGPTQSDGGTEFFEVRNPEGNVIEVCKDL